MQSALIPLPRVVIGVTGEDAAAFLDALVTQRVGDRPVGSCSYAGLLTPQGKLIADFFIWRPGIDAFWLDVDQGAAAALIKRLTLYKLRAKIEVADLRATHGVYAALGMAQPSETPTLIAIDPRMPDGGLGHRFVARASGPWNDELAIYQGHGLKSGVPDLAADAQPEELFALEALFEELNGVDFHKGCFVGQENVSRMKRRATTRKKLCPITFQGEPPAPATPISAGDAVLGDVRTGGAGRAFALIRLDRALEALDKGEILMAGDLPVRLDPPPWLLMPSAKEQD
jgi:folate-binding protein YgfZ